MGARFYVNSRYVSDTCINLRQYTWEVSTFWRYLLDGGLNQTNLKCGLRSRISFLRNPWGVKGFERLSLKELSTLRLKSTIIPWENIPVLEEGPYFIVKIIYGNNALFKAVNKERGFSGQVDLTNINNSLSIFVSLNWTISAFYPWTRTAKKLIFKHMNNFFGIFWKKWWRIGDGLMTNSST